MDIVPITLWREARGEGYDGMLAVAWVIANRARHGKPWPNDPEQVCLQPYQFSCWNTNDPGRKSYPAGSDPQYLAARQICESMQGQPADADPTHGATFYVNPTVVTSNPFDNPQYVETARIGRHVFYRSAA